MDSIYDLHPAIVATNTLLPQIIGFLFALYVLFAVTLLIMKPSDDKNKNACEYSTPVEGAVLFKDHKNHH